MRVRPVSRLQQRGWQQQMVSLATEQFAPDVESDLDSARTTEPAPPFGGLAV
jgi:hypothetical protein